MASYLILVRVRFLSSFIPTLHSSTAGVWTLSARVRDSDPPQITRSDTRGIAMEVLHLVGWTVGWGAHGKILDEQHDKHGKLRNISNSLLLQSACAGGYASISVNINPHCVVWKTMRPSSYTRQSRSTSLMNKISSSDEDDRDCRCNNHSLHEKKRVPFLFQTFAI